MRARSTRPSFETGLVVLLLIGAATAVAGRFLAVGDTDLTVWGDRDLWRGLEAVRHWPILGPETNGGTRTPGGAFYLLLAGMLAFHPGVVAADVGVALFFAVSTLLLWATFAREVSPLAGALVAAAFAGSGMLVGEDLGVWNPGYVDLFAVIATVAAYYFIRYGRAAALGVATAAIAVGMQVHLQITGLALGLAVAVAIFRPRLGWRHAAAFAAGLIIPFLPTLVADGPRLLLETAAVPGDAVDAYVFLEFNAWQKLGLLYDLLGGCAASFALATGGRYPWGTAALGAADVLTAGLAIVFLLRLLRPLPGRLRSDRPGAFAVFAVIALSYLAVAMISFVNGRHLVAVLPAVAIMTGLAAEEVVVGLRRAGGAAAGAAAAVCVLIAARPVLLGVVMMTGRDFSLASTRAQEEIATVVKARFYADHEAFESHAAMFQRGSDGRWQLRQGGLYDRMAFIYRTATVPPTARDRDECLAIVAKDGVEGDPRPSLAASPALADLAPAFGETGAESAHFVYLPYVARDGNCLKTFPNAYIPSAFEAAYLPPDAAAAAGADADGAVFVAPQVGRHFPLGVEIRRDGGHYVAVLHGRLLRGYTGLYFRIITAPTLCLVADDGGATVVSFGRVAVGSPVRGTLAPWRSPRFDLADGRYELWLTGRDGRQPQAVDLHLGRLLVPGVAAAAPAAAGQPAPAACAEVRPQPGTPPP